MKAKRLQLIGGILLTVWSGMGMAQNGGTNEADALRQNYYEKLLESSSDMTEEQQQMLEHKLKALRLQQAWESKHATQEDVDNTLMPLEEEETGVEYQLSE